MSDHEPCIEWKLAKKSLAEAMEAFRNLRDIHVFSPEHDDYAEMLFGWLHQILDKTEKAAEQYAEREKEHAAAT